LGTTRDSKSGGMVNRSPGQQARHLVRIALPRAWKKGEDKGNIQGGRALGNYRCDHDIGKVLKKGQHRGGDGITG